MRREIAAVKATLKKMNGSLSGAELITTPLGPLYAAANGRGIFLLKFVDESAAGSTAGAAVEVDTASPSAPSGDVTSCEPLFMDAGVS